MINPHFHRDSDNTRENKLFYEVFQLTQVTFNIFLKGTLRASTFRSLKHICGNSTAVFELFERVSLERERFSLTGAPQDLTAALGLCHRHALRPDLLQPGWIRDYSSNRLHQSWMFCFEALPGSVTDLCKVEITRLE